MYLGFAHKMTTIHLNSQSAFPGAFWTTEYNNNEILVSPILFAIQCLLTSISSSMELKQIDLDEGAFC